MTTIIDFETTIRSAEKTAILTPCGKHRVLLGRCWGAGPIFVTCGLNPSTADAYEDDTTIRKDVGFATRLGYSALAKLNLYTYRTTFPKELWALPGYERIDPLGFNALQAAITYCKRYGEPFWATWGAEARRTDTAKRLIERLMREGVQVRALAHLKDGTPAHTCRLPYSVLDGVAWKQQVKL